jgi:CheY-like chemotaxis protein
MKILVGMDERETTLLYQFILVNRGHQVKITETGGKCINTYRKNLQVVGPKDFNNSFMSPYDVVILDQVLPDMNGLEIAKRILAVNPYQRIILTSGSIQEAIILCDERTTNAYSDIVEGIVETVLGRCSR